MGWLGKLFGSTSKAETVGIRIDTGQPFWEIEGKTAFASLPRALVGFLPDGCILYFEGYSPDDHTLHDFFASRAIPEQSHVAPGVSWCWPRQRAVHYHVPATSQNLTELSVLGESMADAEFPVHFLVYREGKVLLWYDLYQQITILDLSVSENAVRSLADALGSKFRLNTDTVEPASGTAS